MIEEKVIKFIETLIDGSAFFIVSVTYNGHASQSKLKVLLDGDQGINIDFCAQVSRQLGTWIEENELISDAYQLEVSSPGLDYPLTTERQYQKSIGRKLNVLLHDGGDKTGVLTELKNSTITIIPEKKRGKAILKEAPVSIDLEDVKLSKIVVVF